MIQTPISQRPQNEYFCTFRYQPGLINGKTFSDHVKKSNTVYHGFHPYPDDYDLPRLESECENFER
jgi:hypothetical protein